MQERGATPPRPRYTGTGACLGRYCPTGTVLASPRGWYDAIDCNKYVVNLGIMLGALLSPYEE